MSSLQDEIKMNRETACGRSGYSTKAQIWLWIGLCGRTIVLQGKDPVQYHIHGSDIARYKWIVADLAIHRFLSSCAYVTEYLVIPRMHVG